MLGHYAMYGVTCQAITREKIMKKAIDVADGEKLIPKHFQLTDTLWKRLEDEAVRMTGANSSWRLRQILREYYEIKENN